MRYALLVAVVAAFAVPTVAVAQDQEGPGTRVVTVTSFEVPIGDREAVFPFMMEYFLPGTQLNPNVLSFRVLIHYWGSNAAQVHLVSEFAEMADIEAECGAPCEEYEAAHPEPEEGDPGYEEFAEARDLFMKYYAHHSDEIYSTPMMMAKTDGELVGTVGPPPEGEDEPEN